MECVLRISWGRTVGQAGMMAETRLSHDRPRRVGQRAALLLLCGMSVFGFGVRCLAAVEPMVDPLRFGQPSVIAAKTASMELSCVAGGHWPPANSIRRCQCGR